MPSIDREALKKIQDLGNRIIRCNKTCEGVNRNQKLGYYPRAFFLEPDGAFIEVVIVGENPGNCKPLERETYRILTELNEGEFASYDGCKRVWKAIAEEAPYYKKMRRFLEAMGLSLNGILWSEAVFCETEIKGSKAPKETFDKCSNEYLKEIVELVPEGKYIVCLGQTAYDYITKLSMEKHKVIGIYHPTSRFGRTMFPKYFEHDSQLKKEMLDGFQRRYGKKDSYSVFLDCEPPFFRLTSSQAHEVEGRKLTGKLESVCTVNGCGEKFVVDRSKMKGWQDDPRVMHLRKVHQLDTIRLGSRFKTRRVEQD